MKQQVEPAKETTYTAEYKNGKSTITTEFEGVKNVFPVVMYSEEVMEKVRQAQRELANKKDPVSG